MSGSGHQTQGLGFGRLLGALSGVAGIALLAAVIGARMSREIARNLPVFPFFDTIARFSTPPTAVVAAVLAGVLLLIAAWGLFARRRFVTWYFPAAGWIGFLVTIAAMWPRQRLWGLLDFALKAGKESGRVPSKATVYDLIQATVPGWVWPTAIGFLVVWVLLLVSGTVYLRRNRDLYQA
jgi:hypothetical protein